MKEPKIEVTGVSGNNGPLVKSVFKTDKYSVFINLDGSSGEYSTISLSIDIEGPGKDKDDFPFESEIKNVVNKDGCLMVSSVKDRAGRIFEDLCLSVKQYLSSSEINEINKYLPSLIKQLDKQYRR